MNERRCAERLGADKRRRSARYDVSVEGIIHGSGGDSQRVTISNLSVEGCRINAPGRRLAAGTALTLGVGPVDLIHARVAWRISSVHGISFEQALHPAVLDHLRLFLSKEPALIEERPAA